MVQEVIQPEINYASNVETDVHDVVNEQKEFSVVRDN